MDGRLHIYYPKRSLNVFEFLHTNTTRADNHNVKPDKVLLFVGGLYDNFGSPAYVADLANLFSATSDQKWRVMHVQLSSAMRGWGQFDIDRDVEEIGVCVSFIRQNLYGEQTKIVLMGHSTGCQDIMHYLTAPNPPGPEKAPRAVVQGAIFQAPVSDREATLDAIQTEPAAKAAHDKCIEMVDQTPRSDRKTTFLPLSIVKNLFGPVPVSMSRFLSLVSPGSPQNPSSEDFFSSDLYDDRLQATFGSISKRNVLETSKSGKPSVLILMSDLDEHVPKHVEKQKMLGRWKGILEDGGTECSTNSLCVPHALHDIGGDDLKSQAARLIIMRSAVIDYSDTTVGDVPSSARRVIEEDQARLIKEGISVKDLEQNLKTFKL